MATFEFKMPVEQANRGTTWDSGIYEQVDFSPIPNVRILPLRITRVMY
jgi:hypothetical protein